MTSKFPGRALATANSSHCVASKRALGSGFRRNDDIFLSSCRRQATTTGIFPILACHSFGPVWCTELPLLSTATVTGMSCTVNS